MRALEQHAAAAVLRRLRHRLQRWGLSQVREQPLKFGAVGGEPGGALALPQPLAGLACGREAIEPIRIKQQQPVEGLQAAGQAAAPL